MMFKVAIVLFAACMVVNAWDTDEVVDAGIRGQGDLKHRSGLYVGTDGLSVVFVTSTSNDTEWKFTSDNRWVHIATGNCVHPNGGSAQPADNTFLVLHGCTEVPARFSFKGVASGSYWHIQQITSGKCIHPDGGTAHDGTKLVIHTGCGDEDKLDFILEDASGNTVPLT